MPIKDYSEKNMHEVFQIDKELFNEFICANMHEALQLNEKLFNEFMLANMYKMLQFKR